MAASLRSVYRHMPKYMPYDVLHAVRQGEMKAIFGMILAFLAAKTA
jgi:hypothetical protein